MEFACKLAVFLSNDRNGAKYALKYTFKNQIGQDTKAKKVRALTAGIRGCDNRVSREFVELIFLASYLKNPFLNQGKEFPLTVNSGERYKR